VCFHPCVRSAPDAKPRRHDGGQDGRINVAGAFVSVEQGAENPSTSSAAAPALYLLREFRWSNRKQEFVLRIKRDELPRQCARRFVRDRRMPPEDSRRHFPVQRKRRSGGAERARNPDEKSRAGSLTTVWSSWRRWYWGGEPGTTYSLCNRLRVNPPRRSTAAVGRISLHLRDAAASSRQMPRSTFRLKGTELPMTGIRPVWS
jgi:hypothetical protein